MEQRSRRLSTTAAEVAGASEPAPREWGACQVLGRGSLVVGPEPDAGRCDSGSDLRIVTESWGVIIHMPCCRFASRATRITSPADTAASNERHALRRHRPEGREVVEAGARTTNFRMFTDGGALTWANSAQKGRDLHVLVGERS